MAIGIAKKAARAKTTAGKSQYRSAWSLSPEIVYSLSSLELSFSPLLMFWRISFYSRSSRTAAAIKPSCLSISPSSC